MHCFSDILDEYINYQDLYLKPTSILNLKRKINNHIKPYFEFKKIEEINDDDYLNWLNYLKKLNYSESFNNQLQGIMKNVFSYASKRYNVVNIVEKYKRIIVFNNKISERRIWTKFEYKKFIKCVDDVVFHALFNTLFFTGLRKGEALALRFSDILDCELYINKSITKEFFDGKRLETIPKTKNSIRKVLIDRKLKKELLNLKKYYYSKYSYFDDNFYIFGGVKPIATTTLERKKNKYCDLANVKQIRIHDFRHSHATMLYDHNVNIKVIQARLGHSSISTTLNTYVHIDKEKEKRVLRTLISLH